MSGVLALKGSYSIAHKRLQSAPRGVSTPMQIANPHDSSSIKLLGCTAARTPDQGCSVTKDLI